MLMWRGMAPDSSVQRWRKPGKRASRFESSSEMLLPSTSTFVRFPVKLRNGVGIYTVTCTSLTSAPLAAEPTPPGHLLYFLRDPAALAAFPYPVASKPGLKAGHQLSMPRPSGRRTPFARGNHFTDIDT